MSDRIFAFILRLYPARFRSRYSHEMLQLYRDRLRDETGLIRRLRLSFDLFADILFAVPNAYKHSFTSSPQPSLAHEAYGIPSFRAVEREPLRPASILLGSTLTITAIVLFSILMTHPGATNPFPRNGGPVSPIESVLRKLNQPAFVGSPDQPGQGSEVIASSQSQSIQSTSMSLPAQASAPAGKSNPAALQNPSTAAAAIGSPQASSAQTASRNPSSISFAPAPNLSAEERNRVIQSVADTLVAHYYDRARAQQASADLISLQKVGYYNAIGDGQTLASRLTFALQRSTGDPHIKVEFSGNVLPSGPPTPSAAALDQYRATMQQENCTFENVQVLPGNIGYIKLNSFPDPAICAATAQAAIARLNRSSAIIFDLRGNTGGYPQMVATMAAPLFDRPVRWYNPREGDGSTWLSPERGTGLANKPVYILTSPITLSAAEQFTYNLKMLKRATIVGDTTGGSAHIGVFHRIDDHFGMGIPERRINNPYGKPDWEGTGVVPDVKVAPANALTTAEDLARKHFKK